MRPRFADYLPPFGKGALTADADGHLWILPRASSASRAGELVYDVVDGRGALIQRVRLPQGRTVIGFGPSGIVYLTHKDAAGWVLERARVKLPK